MFRGTTYQAIASWVALIYLNQRRRARSFCYAYGGCRHAALHFNRITLVGFGRTTVPNEPINQPESGCGGRRPRRATQKFDSPIVLGGRELHLNPSHLRCQRRHTSHLVTHDTPPLDLTAIRVEHCDVVRAES